MAKMRVGRPRSEKSQEAILEAAHALLTERGGAGLSIEAIARRAGVGKPTIYRWWPTLADIVLDVVLRQADKSIPLPPFVSLQETLCHFLRQSMTALQWGGAHLRFLMAQAQKDEAFRERFRDNFVARRREALLSLLQKAVEKEEIAQDQNLELLTDLVFGAMWYRLLIGHAPLDPALAEELSQAVVRLSRASLPGA